jgi:hydroxymethylglutaryl-CoA synthase
MAVAAAQSALDLSGIKKDTIQAVFIGSESHPYAVKPTGTIVAEWLDLPHFYYCGDLEFACKAGTTGMQIVAAFIEAGMIDAGLVIGVDKAQSRPGDALEYTAASAAVAYILTRKPGIAKIRSTVSYCSDTPDFWRRQTEEYPSHTGRFTGKPAYFKHIEEATTKLLKETDKKITDFDHVVFHMPNGKFPLQVSKKLGVNSKQLKTGFTVKNTGNPYSASSLLGLARVLAFGEKGDNILVSSYGSGAGSDSFWIEQVSRGTKKMQKNIESQLNTELSITYTQYLQEMGILNLL